MPRNPHIFHAGTHNSNSAATASAREPRAHEPLTTSHAGYAYMMLERGNARHTPLADSPWRRDAPEMPHDRHM